MSLKERIRGILDKFKKSKKYEKLPTTFILDTGIIPIICEGNSKDEFAIYIKEEIQQYPDFYKVFLSDYDGICIGDTYRSDFKNPLVIQRGIRIRVPYGTINAEEEQMQRDRKNAIDFLEYSLNNRFRNRFTAIKFELMRQNYNSNSTDFKKNLEMNEKERRFHELILRIYYSPNSMDMNMNLRKDGNSDYLYINKDYTGVMELLEDPENFADRFVKNHSIEMLNCALDNGIIQDEDNFFNRNNNLIFDAVNLTKKNISDYKADRLKFAAFQNQYVEDNKDNLLKMEMLYRLYKMDMHRKKSANFEININQIIDLVSQILLDIDPDGNLNSSFNQALKEGKIIIYDYYHPEDAIEQWVKLGLSQEVVDHYFKNKPSCYENSSILFCNLPVFYRITDIPIIIHEFIHFYHINNGKPKRFDTEAPSVYYEVYAIGYLIQHGFGEFEEMLKQIFIERKINDSNNNSGIIDLVKLINLKRKNGQITKYNLLNIGDNIPIDLKDFESLFDFIANDLAKKYLLYLRDDVINYLQQSDIITACSYAIGTYFSEKYANNPKMKKCMLELISNPDYTLQDLIDTTYEEEQQNKKKSGVVVE